MKWNLQKKDNILLVNDFFCLPKDARTLLKTKSVECNSVKEVNPGTYYHFGIGNGIIRHFLDSTSNDEIKLVVGIDGLPISKSSSTQFWPILGYIRSISNHVFPIGVYCGTQKPIDSNEYLKDFVTEAEQLILNGIYINSKFYKVVLDVVCCDVPAKSFVLKIKSHNGFYSCTRCKIEGEYIENRLCFLILNHLTDHLKGHIMIMFNELKLVIMCFLTIPVW